MINLNQSSNQKSRNFNKQNLNNFIYDTMNSQQSLYQQINKLKSTLFDLESKLNHNYSNKQPFIFEQKQKSFQNLDTEGQSLTFRSRKIDEQIYNLERLHLIYQQNFKKSHLQGQRNCCSIDFQQNNCNKIQKQDFNLKKSSNKHYKNKKVNKQTNRLVSCKSADNLRINNYQNDMKIIKNCQYLSYDDHGYLQFDTKIQLNYNQQNNKYNIRNPLTIHRQVQILKKIKNRIKLSKCVINAVQCSRNKQRCDNLQQRYKNESNKKRQLMKQVYTKIFNSNNRFSTPFIGQI